MEDTILRVKPVTVVLELDEERFNILERAAAEGSHRMPTVPSKITEVLGLYMSGSLPRLVSQLTDSLSQSVLGATPGGEFVAAACAAQEVGASVVLADRPADVSWHRVENLMRQLRMQEQRVADADLARMRRMLDEGPGSRGGGGLGNELEVGKQEAWTRWLRAPALPDCCLRSWLNVFMPWSLCHRRIVRSAAKLYDSGFACTSGPAWRVGHGRPTGQGGGLCTEADGQGRLR